MKEVILLIFFLSALILFAQDWSQPVNLSNTDGIDENPDFCIDSNGFIHCVWTYKIESNYRKIYYSKSEDNGETWSYPLDLLQNDEMWMGLPHIVSDSQDNLYIAYLYNVGNSLDSHIYFLKYDGLNWSEPYSISGDFLGVGMSDVVIDNNDRVYIFWSWGGATGEIYYRYLENNEWSGIVCPYENNSDHYSLAEGVSDSNNNLHCIIDYHPENIGSRTSYIKYNYATDIWEAPIVLATRMCQQGNDIYLDNNEYPHLVWREYINDVVPPNDGTLYSYFDGATFSEPDILVEDPWWQVIAIDGNNNKHIVETEKYDTGAGIVHNLVYYSNLNTSWEGTIIFESENYAGLPKLNIFENKLFLVFYNSNSVTESDIYFMKKELSTFAIDENYINNISAINLSQNYPNPFNPETQIDYSLRKGGLTTLKILNTKGQLVKTLISNYKNKGNYSVIWDGTDMQNKKVSSAIYYYRLQVDNHVKTNTLTLIK